jgi:hypothetical protein
MPDYIDQFGVDKVNRALRIGLETVYLRALKERTPYKTGNVSGLWDVNNPQPLVFEFVNQEGVIVASLEEGSKEHIIKAEPGHYLRFKKGSRKSPYRKIPGNRAFEKDGYIYALMVRHPGFGGRHFVRAVFDDEELFNAFQERVMQELMSA